MKMNRFVGMLILIVMTFLPCTAIAQQSVGPNVTMQWQDFQPSAPDLKEYCIFLYDVTTNGEMPSAEPICQESSVFKKSMAELGLSHGEQKYIMIIAYDHAGNSGGPGKEFLVSYDSENAVRIEKVTFIYSITVGQE